MPFVIAFALGAIAGSFLNVCIIRIPIKESILFPASHCLSCRRAIAWYDNIPIVSFFILKGRCRNCAAGISWQYPVVETLSALLFVLFYAVYGLTATGIIYLVLSLALFTQSFIDFKYQIIPDGITLPGIVLGLGLSTFFPVIHGADSWTVGLWNAILGVVVGGGILYLIGTVAEFFLKKEAMGGGDVKLLAMIGAFVGWGGVLGTLFLSSFIGSIVGLYFRFKKGEERIPFGPYLALAAFLYLFFGQRVFESYRQLIGWA